MFGWGNGKVKGVPDTRWLLNTKINKTSMASKHNNRETGSHVDVPTYIHTIHHTPHTHTITRFANVRRET